MAVVALLCLSGCTSRSAQNDGPAGDVPITVAWTGSKPGYNTQLAGQGDVTASRQVLGGVLSGFWRLDASANPIPNSDLGTVTKLSDQPLRVRYTVNPKALWSDGQAIDCDDLMLAWAAHSGRIERGGKPLFNGTTSQAWHAARPSGCRAGSRTLTFTYPRPNADWQSLFGGAEPLLPAHVVERTAGMTPAALVAAVARRDAAGLARAAQAWNRPDWATQPSSGPYVIGRTVPGQTVTLQPNRRWWGHAPRTKNIVFRHVADSEAPQALENGEVDVAAPQPTVSTAQALTDQGSATTVIRTGSLRYEQVEFNLAGRFKDQTLRRAMATCVPRDDFATHYAVPLDPGAQALDARLTLPLRGDYRSMVKVAGLQRYAHNDIPAAAGLVSSRHATGMTVRLAYPAGDVLRASEAKRIFDACGGAGFKTRLMPVKSLPTKGWDIALTNPTLPAFQGEAAASLPRPSRRVRSLTRALQGQLSADEQRDTLTALERELGSELHTLPLYPYPNLTAYRKVDGVNPTVDPAGLTWNVQEWTRR